MMKKIIYLLFLGLVLVQCEDVIDVDLDDAAPRLVIDARLELLEDGSSRNTVLLTRSSGFFEEVNPLVSDAIVFVTDGNGVDYDFTYDAQREIYVNETIAITNDLDYTLTVLDGDQRYTAIQRLVSTVPLTDVEQEEVTGFGDFVQVTSFFEDPPEFGNNYLFTYEDPDNFQVDVSDDEFINGNRTPNVFFIEELEPGTQIQLTITGIDAQAFRFFETLIQQTADGGGGPFDTQPATVRGNIINATNRDQFPFGYFRVAQVFELDYVSQ